MNLSEIAVPPPPDRHGLHGSVQKRVVFDLKMETLNCPDDINFPGRNLEQKFTLVADGGQRYDIIIIDVSGKFTIKRGPYSYDESPIDPLA
jgi:hypothetical protein